jgi:hypothetical protein
MGTSVRVATYMKAPTTPAKRFALSELPPTSRATQSEGMSPSWPGRPSSNPATSTPAKSSGRICLAKVQVDEVHSESSSRLNQPASIPASPMPKTAVTGHFAAWISAHRLCSSPAAGRPQLAKTSTPTIEAK